MDRVRIATTVRPETRQRIYSLMERNPRTLTTVGETIDYLVTLEAHDARDAMRARTQGEADPDEGHQSGMAQPTSDD